MSLRENGNVLTKWIAIGSIAFGGAWAKIPYTIQALLLLMALDITSGLLAAIKQRAVNSSVMLRGLATKGAILVLLGVLHIIEKPLNIPFELESMAAIAFIVYEAMSITENCANAGVPIPLFVVKVLAKAKVKSATPEEIEREFAGDATKVTAESSSKILKTPDGLPDLKVDKKITTFEETHIEQVPQNTESKQ